MLKKWAKRSLATLAAVAFLLSAGLTHDLVTKSFLLVGLSGIGQTHANGIITADFTGTSTYASPVTLYLAVFTATPSDTGVGTEVTTSGTAYARIAVTCNGTNFTPITAGTVFCTFVCTFATATANYGTCTQVAFMAAVSGGAQPYYWGDLNAPVIINTSNQLSFPANSLEVAYV